jgi:hypothetical protein
MGPCLVENILYFFTKIFSIVRIIFYFHFHFLYSIIFYFFIFLFSILTFLFISTNYNSKFNNISFFTIIDFLRKENIL